MNDKRITNTTKFILCLFNIGLFSIIWFGFYNGYTFDKYRIPGGFMSCVIYGIIYLSMCSLYKAFRIASTSIGDTVFGQTISFGAADVILYVECCLIHNRYVSILPGLTTALMQIAATLIIVTLSKRYMMKHLVPQNTLIIYGKTVDIMKTGRFAERLLKKYNHLFHIRSVESEECSRSRLNELIHINDVVILYEVSGTNRGKYMQRCLEEHKIFYFTPDIEDLLCQGASAKNLLDTPLMKYGYHYESRRGYIGKRILDLALSVTVTVIFSPVMLLTAAAIKLEDHGPVFYRQKRCTMDGKVFDIIKFRSMIVDAEKDGALLCTKADARITRVGKVIRATRIDELPQIFNILKGEMSFVGPRPERVENVRQYTEEMPEFGYRLRVKGGLTGYAQIFGKYNTSAYDKLRLDLMYIENQSLSLDLKLIMLTFKTMFTAESTEGFDEEQKEAMSREIGKQKSAG